ncbi:reverse transcriptase domain-containing protein [Tanacetum coccineum]
MYLAAAKEAISTVLMKERDGKQTHIYFVSRALQGPKVNYTLMEKLILALEEHDIHYRPRTSIKGQILADFIVECPEEDPLDTPMEDKEELLDPWVLFTDRSDNPFKDWCEKLCIHQYFTSIKHPQANGLVERANRSLGEVIKARNGETPFSLTYGTEAVIPVEIGMPTLRSAEVDMTKNNEALEINLDLLEERREQAAIQEAKKQSQDGKIL